MMYARINLEETNYSVMDNCKLLENPDPEELERIYNEYCVYKRFKSVMPIFPEEYTADHTNVLAYYDEDKIVAFSLIHLYNSSNIEAVQFAWDYKNPRLRLGIESLKSECAYYKSQGYKYFYLGGADEYKSGIDGFEILGPRY